VFSQLGTHVISRDVMLDLPVVQSTVYFNYARPISHFALLQIPAMTSQHNTFKIKIKITPTKATTGGKRIEVTNHCGVQDPIAVYGFVVVTEVVLSNNAACFLVSPRGPRNFGTKCVASRGAEKQRRNDRDKRESSSRALVATVGE